MRGKKAPKRLLIPDTLYANRLITRLINRSMRDGKKMAAQKQIYKALEILQEKAKDQEVAEVFRQAMENAKPTMEVRSRRVGGAAYQVPTPVKGDRREALAIRWVIAAARKRANSQFHTFAEKLAAELWDAYNGEGEAIKRKETTHKMADANKAFAHFRW
ncbi:30S ribosomal protein S7 [Candidatus Beckwithbacteria bacterium RBG_13_42_9]|uniref:Small ribosomal subunit protein uS7 n=1 Tax=Candidatus Beckwithbacteria bacterium RBG_13_42_9 TaxID=1797457 RepID=A0A1F5E379_9BACT|nr:MAG: 30S ribosomal protein S7 [Candidatus Beckwithbacteria bacterium RBG_13_42_9]